MIAFIGAPASYWGTWAQTGGNDRLQLEYYDGTSNVASFSGFAVGNDCFEGVTIFHPASPYVAPYRVCMQQCGQARDACVVAQPDFRKARLRPPRELTPPVRRVRSVRTATG